MNRINTLFAVVLVFALTGCDGVGLPDATDEYYAGEAATTAQEAAFPGADVADEEEEVTEPPADETETADEESETETGTDDEPEYASECLFGSSVADMAQADWLDVGSFDHVFAASELMDLEKEQLLAGFAEHGSDSVADIDELFGRFIDDGRVMVRTVVDVDTDIAYTHLAFWSQGREKGYLFLEDTLRLMAAVDGGTIYACVVGF